MANAVRGEMTILFGDKAYVAAPTYKALANIETKLGPFCPLVGKFFSRQVGLAEIATVIHECIKAGCEKPGDAPKYDSICELIVEEGVYTCLPHAMNLLSAYVSKDAGGDAPGEPTGSPT